jgi:hypothetical protein
MRRIRNSKAMSHAGAPGTKLRAVFGDALIWVNGNGTRHEALALSVRLLPALLFVVAIALALAQIAVRGLAEVGLG